MKKLFFLGFLLSLLVSCNENLDLYDPDYDNPYLSYERGFVNLYGNVSPDQVWDFSSGKSLITRAGDDIKIEGVAGLDFKVENTVKKSGGILNPKYTLNTSIHQNVELYNDIQKILPDGKTNKGSEAVLSAPSNSFMIYPVMAQGAYTYDLYVKVGDVEYKVFTKNWTQYDKPYVNGMGYSLSGSTPICASLTGVYVDAPIGTPIQIYLKNIKSGNKSVTDKMVGTGTGNAIVVQSSVRPEGLSSDIMPDNAVIKYVGIEDNIDGGDKDYNDLVLAIVGNPYVPEELIIEEDEYTVPIAKPAKRYMIEDLGSFDDFDFNDIVVDVNDIVTATYHIKKVNGVITENVEVGRTHYQTANVKHLGGILQFKLKIGNTIIDDISPRMFADVDYNYMIDGWIPDENNIEVTVISKDGERTNKIGFPSTGKIPMIMAFDTNVKWMEERVSIPKEWIKK